MIKIREIKLIKIFWHDPKIEKRRKLIKFQDKSINYSTDVIPHIINILDLIFGHKNNKPKRINAKAPAAKASATIISCVFNTPNKIIQVSLDTHNCL